MASGNSNIGGTSGMGGLGNITSKLQEFGSSTVQKVGNLSTTQKVVGCSLLALGAGWVTVNSLSKGNKDQIKRQFNTQVDKIKDMASSFQGTEGKSQS